MGMRNTENEREKHLKTLRQSLEQMTGSQELPSALCQPVMALQSHNQVFIYFSPSNP